MKQIKLYNLETTEIIEGFIIDEYDKDYQSVTISLHIQNGIFKATGKHIFEAVSKLREKIYPLEPMIIATQKYVIYRKGGYYSPTKLGERRHPRELRRFFFGNDDNNFTSPSIQLSYMKLYEESFKSKGEDGLLAEYDIKGNYNILEKVPKYLHLPEKILNKNYQYFWIYDMDTEKIYDIKNKDDIELFKKGKIKPSWNNLDSFLEYYAENWFTE